MTATASSETELRGATAWLVGKAAMTFTLRMARAMDTRADPQEDLRVRRVTAVGQYGICKRTPTHAYEAMECIGGSGVMEDSMMTRLYREASVNAILEGRGNVQCLDVLRAMTKTSAEIRQPRASAGTAKQPHIATKIPAPVAS